MQQLYTHQSNGHGWPFEGRFIPLHTAMKAWRPTADSSSVIGDESEKSEKSEKSQRRPRANEGQGLWLRRKVEQSDSSTPVTAHRRAAAPFSDIDSQPLPPNENRKAEEACTEQSQWRRLRRGVYRDRGVVNKESRAC